MCLLAGGCVNCQVSASKWLCCQVLASSWLCCQVFASRCLCCQVFDKDDSGFIDKQELAKVLRSTGEKLSRDDIDKVFDSIDTNGDGQINYEGDVTRS